MQEYGWGWCVTTRFGGYRVPMRLTLILVCVLTSGCASISADFVVAPSGSDDNPGTPAEPFATLSKARDAARDIRREAPGGQVSVALRGGTYRLAKPVVFGPAEKYLRDRRSGMSSI